MSATKPVVLNGLQLPSDHAWRKTVWLTQDGRAVQIKGMSDMHLLNTGKMLFRQRKSGRVPPQCLPLLNDFLSAFALELIYRGLHPDNVEADCEVILEDDLSLPGETYDDYS